MPKPSHIITTFITSTTLTAALFIPSFAQFVSSDVMKLNRFVQSTNSSDKAAKAFRVGRDLIEDEKWEQAEKQFRNFMRDYPQHNQVDAALYWLAYTQKKQKHFPEAEQLLNQLLTNYPKSSWTPDAKALRLEIAPALGNEAYAVQVVSDSQPFAKAPKTSRAGAQATTTVSAPQPAQAPAQRGQTITGAVGFEPFAPPAPPVPVGAIGVGSVYGIAVAQSSATSAMTEQDEIKAIALQSLMQSNPERALPYIAEILKNDSKASKGLKENAVRLLGQYRGPSATNLLLDLARNQTDSKLRRSAIYSLGNVEDNDKVFDLLLDLATKAEDPEVAKTALRALANHRNQKAKDSISSLALNAKSPFIRRDAIYFLGERKDDTSIDRLISIYENDADPEIKKHALYALSRSSNPKARQKIFDVARSSSNEESRVQAIQWLDDRADDKFIDELVKMYQTDKSARVRKQIVYSLSQASCSGAYTTITTSPGQNNITVNVPNSAQGTTTINGWDASSSRNACRSKALQALMQMYDAESDEAMKSQFLFAFSQSRSKDAVQKLIQVAKNDSSMTIRRKAVTYLGQSRDPEAVKFLEELLK